MFFVFQGLVADIGVVAYGVRLSGVLGCEYCKAVSGNTDDSPGFRASVSSGLEIEASTALDPTTPSLVFAAIQT